MRALPLVALIAFIAVPAAAQPPAPPPPAQDAVPDDGGLGPLPSRRQIEEMAPALDRMTGAMLDTDIGPILDAADPLRRGRHYGQPGRTIGRMASRNDPDFEQRLHASIYGGADKLGRMSAALSAAAPVLAQQAQQLRQSLHQAMRAWRDAYRGATPAPAPHAPDHGTPGGIPDDD